MAYLFTTLCNLTLRSRWHVNYESTAYKKTNQDFIDPQLIKILFLSVYFWQQGKLTARRNVIIIIIINLVSGKKKR